jgi:hypothetical protein
MKRINDRKASGGAASPWAIGNHKVTRQTEAVTEFAARISSMHQRL